jgi:hypothetical protein
LEPGVDGEHRCDDESRHEDGCGCDKGPAVTGVAHVGSCLQFRRLDPTGPPVVGHEPLVQK